MSGVDLYIVGAGGTGRETLDVALAADHSVAGFIDEKLAGTVVRGLPVVGAEAARPGSGYVVGIADPVTRRRLAGLLEAMGLHAVTVVHPWGVVGPGTTLGAGSVVMGGAYVSSTVTLGAHVQVQYNATVGHDTVLEDYASVLPGANVAGGVHIEQDVTIGSNAVVLQNLRMGQGTFVGAGAVVTRDAGPGLVLVGVPARPR